MRSQSWLYAGALILIVIAVFSLVRVLQGPEATYITDTVTRGDVRSIVSVSGVIEAENTAELAFPVSGIVAEISVREGDEVTAGTVLAALERNALLADRREALGRLQIAKADRQELMAGPRSEAREVTATSIAAAEENLIRVTREEDEKVANARRTLYSDDLEASPVNKSVVSTSPTITGVYTCTESGQYKLEMFASGAQSGFSYLLSGLESEVQSAYTSAAAPLGSCGLQIQFTEGGRIGVSDWIISIPNSNGSSYTTNLNTYELAVEQRHKKIAEAEEALDLARKEQTLENAAPRSEALDRANAAVLQAQARLAGVDAALDDRTLTAPFDGTITAVEVLAGETVTTAPVITLLSDDAFELTARIPEIDIAKVTVGQKAEVVFDAEVREMLEADIAFISPIATEIDGVAYFEAKLQFAETPVWLRSGLNADIEIIVNQYTDSLKVPTRFVTERDDRAYILIREDEEVIEQEVTIEFRGNDGFTAISGLTEGAEIIAP